MTVITSLQDREVGMSRIEVALMRIWGLTILVIGGIIGWHLHNLFA